MQIKTSFSMSVFLENLQDDGSETSKLLRGYVDEWIDTGLDGVDEDPRRRSLDRAPSAFRALHRYLSEYPLMVMVTSNGYHGHFGLRHLYEKDPTKHAENQAAWLFTALIDSDWRDQVYKCRRCGEYGVLSRKPADISRKPEPLYKRGIHCAKCRCRATASVATKKKRDAQFEDRLKLAAEYWQRWKKGYGDRKAYVVAKVNERMLHDEHIKVNWVTWNLSAIEKEAEKRSAKR